MVVLIALHRIQFCPRGQKYLKEPSVFGPGLVQVPGGPDYLNRTVMSWHYYCWAQGVGTAGPEPYDPETRRLCDEGIGKEL